MILRASYLLGAVLTMVLGDCPCANTRLATTLNYDATLKGELAANPMQGKVITSWINTKDHTMSTLFGNDPAIKDARAKETPDYRPGSVLSLVTWSWQEDPRWFGGNIPQKPRSVEVVTVKEGNVYVYQKYECSPLKQVANEESATPGEDAMNLLSQHAAAMP
jgi:hypothetical protein